MHADGAWCPEESWGMQAFLSPGIKLLGRFGFAGKFQLLFLLFILPLAGSLLMIGQDYRDKLNLISGERAGVRQLLAGCAGQPARRPTRPRRPLARH